MKYYFCLISSEEAKTPQNLGRHFVFTHRDRWIENTAVAPYLTAGYVKGVDFVEHEGKAYMILKTFINIDPGEPFVAILAAESTMGCDID